MPSPRMTTNGLASRSTRSSTRTWHRRRAAGAALEVWKNDVLIQRFPEAGAIGNWVQDHYCPAGADGAQCNYSPTAPGPLDLQFRSSTALPLNHLWLQNYITDTTAGRVWLDDVVVA